MKAELLNDFLCESDPDAHSLTCHRALQTSIRTSLSTDEFEESFQAAAVLLLREWPSKRKLKSIIYGSWPDFDSLHSHLHKLSQIIFEAGYGHKLDNIILLRLASDEFLRLLIFFSAILFEINILWSFFVDRN